MRTRRFGRMDMEVSELALGTWGLSGDAYGPVYHKEVDAVIDRAMESGITLYDTADVYGEGAMESKLGERLSDECMIVTKIGTQRDGDTSVKKFDADSLRVAFERSQERIGRDPLDVVLLHNPSLAALQAGEASEFLRAQVKAKKLKAWGVSAGSLEVANTAIDLGAEVLELVYNAFALRDMHQLADRIAMTDTALLARSVLAHGLLAGHWSAGKTFFDNDHRAERWTEEGLRYRREQLVALRPFVRGQVVTLRAVALRFVLCNELVSSAVLGPRSTTQLNQLVREAGAEPPYLDEQAMQDLPKRLEAVGIQL